MGCLITDGERYFVKRNKWEVEFRKERCPHFREEKVEVMLDELKKAKKVINQYSIDINKLKIENTISYEEVSSIQRLSKDFNIEEFANNISTTKAQIYNRKAELLERLSICDKEQEDILHASEFFKLDVVRGYKIYKMLHDVRNRRREIKQELDKIRMTLGCFNEHINILPHTIEGINNRQYAPRVLTELFNENGGII